MLSLFKKAWLNICSYTLKNKGASKGSSSDAIEVPFLVPQGTILSNVL